MSKPNVLDKEYLFEGRAIVSETNTRGIITFANRKFCEISGYDKNELIGKPHSITRHPDMPRAVFAQIWNQIQAGNTWHGLIKNLHKNGLYYWAETEISPIQGSNGAITGYIAARKPANRKDIEETQILYQKLLENEK